MIHTGEFLVNLDYRQDYEIIKYLKEKGVYTRKECRVVYRKIRNPFTCEIKEQLHLYVDFIKLLERTDIMENDCDEILLRINAIIYMLLKREFILILMRIDYRYDVKVEDPKMRALILKLIKKASYKVNYMRKINKYSSTVRYFSKSRCNNIYDKEIERIAKEKNIEAHEKSLLRFEAQIKSEHIKYRCKNYGVDKDFRYYFTYQMYKKYMTNMIIKTVSKGDFYSLREATKIINKTDMRAKVKIELREFLLCTSRSRCLSKTKEQFGRSAFNRLIKKLEDLGINPIIIPEKERIKFIRNPIAQLIEEFHDEENLKLHAKI